MPVPANPFIIKSKGGSWLRLSKCSLTKLYASACISLKVLMFMLLKGLFEVVNNSTECVLKEVRSCFTLCCILCQILNTGLVIYNKLNITVCTPALKLKSLVTVESGVIPFSYNLYFIFWCVILGMNKFKL